MSAHLRMLCLAITLAMSMGVMGTPSAEAAAPLAELVSYRIADNVGLNALLRSPPAPTRNVAILVPGFYGNMIGGHDYTPMARDMAARGYAFMTINMQTNSNFTDPRIEDAIPDTAAAVNFAKQRGFTNIVMTGTSLGGPRSTLYLAEARDPAVLTYVLLAAIMSPYEEGQLRLDAAHRAKDDEVLAQARALVAAGRPMDVVVYED